MAHPGIMLVDPPIQVVGLASIVVPVLTLYHVNPVQFPHSLSSNEKCRLDFIVRRRLLSSGGSPPEADESSTFGNLSYCSVCFPDPNEEITFAK